MIKREFYKERNDGVKLYKTYSDENYRIQKVGTDEIYDEAIDVFPIQYNYEETSEKVEIENNQLEDSTYNRNREVRE